MDSTGTRTGTTPLTPTVSTLNQIGQAAAALVWILGNDSRVQAAYAAWRGRLRGDTLTALKASVLANKPADIAALKKLLREDLGLRYPWLPSVLLADFGVTFGAELDGQPRPGLMLTPDAPPDIDRGRRAKNEGRHIVRDVEWFYRAKIKQPRETVYAIAKEHAARERSARTWHSVVQNGIARAEQLLDGLDDDETAI